VRNSIINGVVFGYVLFLVYTYVGSAAKMDAGNYLHFILVDVHRRRCRLICRVLGEGE